MKYFNDCSSGHTIGTDKCTIIGTPKNDVTEKLVYEVSTPVTTNHNNPPLQHHPKLLHV